MEFSKRGDDQVTGARKRKHGRITGDDMITCSLGELVDLSTTNFIAICSGKKAPPL